MFMRARVFSKVDEVWLGFVLKASNVAVDVEMFVDVTRVGDADYRMLVVGAAFAPTQPG
jgi:hypothetical protein